MVGLDEVMCTLRLHHSFSTSLSLSFLTLCLSLSFSVSSLPPSLYLSLSLSPFLSLSLSFSAPSFSCILQCTRTGALNAFFAEFGNFSNDSETTYLSTICCGCSVATLPVAEISHYWNIPQVSRCRNFVCMYVCICA